MDLIGGEWLRKVWRQLRASAGTNTSGTDRKISTNLYTCSPCDRTYISEEMTSCPECGQEVERIPSEQELSLRSDGQGKESPQREG